MGVRAGTWLLALTAVLAACSSEEPPSTLPPVGTPKQAEATPTARASPVNASLEQTSAGAAAFATFFLETVGQAYQLGDPTLIVSLTEPGCGGCDILVSGVSELRKNSQRRSGGDYLVKSAVAPALRDGDVVVDVMYARPASQIVNSNGRVVASAGPVPMTTAQVRVIWRDGGWTVQGYRTFGK